MHSQAALTIREWQRQELLIDAEHERLLKQIPIPLPTQRQTLSRRPQSLVYRLTGLTHTLHVRAGRLVTVSR